MDLFHPHVFGVFNISLATLIALMVASWAFVFIWPHFYYQLRWVFGDQRNAIALGRDGPSIFIFRTRRYSSGNRSGSDFTGKIVGYDHVIAYASLSWIGSGFT